GLVTYATGTNREGAKDTSSTPEVKENRGTPRLDKQLPIRFADDKEKADKKEKKIPAPELEGGVAWLNTASPLRIHDDYNPFSQRQTLKGKIILLDFWTLCCINCIHIMPDLAKLEKKYANELVVIGVHSPKFENEKENASIRKAIL